MFHKRMELTLIERQGNNGGTTITPRLYVASSLVLKVAFPQFRSRPPGGSGLGRRFIIRARIPDPLTWPAPAGDPSQRGLRKSAGWTTLSREGRGSHYFDFGPFIEQQPSRLAAEGTRGTRPVPDGTGRGRVKVHVDFQKDVSEKLDCWCQRGCGRTAHSGDWADRLRGCS